MFSNCCYKTRFLKISWFVFEKSLASFSSWWSPISSLKFHGWPFAIGRTKRRGRGRRNASNSREWVSQLASDGAHLCALRQKTTQHLEPRDRRQSAVKTICTPRTRGSEIHDLVSFSRYLVSLSWNVFSHVERFSLRRLQQYVWMIVVKLLHTSLEYHKILRFCLIKINETKKLYSLNR